MPHGIFKIVPHVMIWDYLKWTMWIFPRLNKNNFEILKNAITCQHIFVVNVDQIDHMFIINRNMYIFSQKMKIYFVDFYFHPKTMSFAIWSYATCQTQLMGF